MRRTGFRHLLWVLLPTILLPSVVTAQGWLTQTYVASALLKADVESLEFPARRDLMLVVPEGISLPEVCVDAGWPATTDRGRTRVRVVISRADAGGEERVVQQVEFEWRESDPPLNASRCRPVQSLLAGDLVEFRFRFFEVPRLEVTRSGRRIMSIPTLQVVGWVRHDPFTG